MNGNIPNQGLLVFDRTASQAQIDISLNGNRFLLRRGDEGLIWLTVETYDYGEHRVRLEMRGMTHVEADLLAQALLTLGANGDME